MGKKGYGIALLLALGATLVLYLSANLPILFFPSSEGTLAPLWSLLLLAVIFVVSAVSMRLAERAVIRDLTQDIALDMVSPGKTERFQMVVLVDCSGSEKQHLKLLRDTTRRVLNE
jgi:hypothetical protein